MLSDHHHTRDELDRFSKAIQAGEAITYDPVVLALNVRVFERMDADPDAFQCTICSGNVDSFDETLCPKCQEHKQ